MTLDEAFALTPLGDGRYQTAVVESDEKRTFGGLLLGQALAAAALTIEDMMCSSLHVVFLAAAVANAPVEITVVRLRDGRKFASRRVEVLQGKQLILSTLATFHAGDNGPEHAAGIPAVPAPEGLTDQRDIRAANAAARGNKASPYIAETLLDIRPVEMPLDQTNGIEGRRAVWFRPRLPIKEQAAMRCAVLAFASDVGLVHVGLQAHNVVGDGRAPEAASLDHAIWFHRDPPAADWLLHVQRSPVAASGRGLALGQIFTFDGRLVANTAQELLERWR